MTTTNDVLAAIGEATTAFHRVPQLEGEIRSLTNDRDYVVLERDEALRTIDELKSRIYKLEDQVSELDAVLSTQRSTIRELEDRNASLDNALSDLRNTANDLRVDLSAADVTNRLLKAENESLERRLEESKSFADRLSDTLKSIGRSIVTAAEVPEVTSEKPFPVSDPVGMPIPSPTLVQSFPDLMVDPLLEPKTDADLVKETAPGTYPHPYWQF